MVPTANINTSPAEKFTSRNSTGRISGLRRPGHVHQEQVGAEAGQHRLDDDLARGEPVLVIAAIQHHLQRADADAEHREAQPVEAQKALAVATRA